MTVKVGDPITVDTAVGLLHAKVTSVFDTSFGATGRVADGGTVSVVASFYLENRFWIHDHHAFDSDRVRAMLAASALNRVEQVPM
jgi:hypothetical protein